MKNIIILMLSLILTNYAYGHDNQSNSTLGNNNNINNCNPTIKCPKAKVKYKTKIRYKTKVVYKTKIVKQPVDRVVTKTVIKKVAEKPLKNSLSVIAGSSQTDLQDHASGNNTVVETDAEFDLGLMYQHDLSKKIRLSILGTMNKSLMLGVGFNF